MVVSVVRPFIVVIALVAAAQPAPAQPGGDVILDVPAWERALAGAGPAELLAFAAHHGEVVAPWLGLEEALAQRVEQPPDAAVAEALARASLPDRERALAWRLYAVLTLPALAPDPLADAVARGLLLIPLLEEWAQGLPAEPPVSPRSHTVYGCDVAEVATPLPLLCIGGFHPNVYSDAFVLTLDQGGNDLYRVPSPGTVETGLPAALLLDQAGDDRHESGPDSQAAGIRGLAVLADLAGHDEYVAGERSQGFGDLGVGFLWDRAGNDTYAAGHYAQGSGLHGIGILLDEGGADSRLAGVEDEGRSYAQGYGAAGGVGLLVDRLGGDDSYTVQKKGQGSGEGSGVGLLLDEGGNDSYHATQEAQGHAQSGGLGLLLEAAGNDVFNATRWAQGFGRGGAGLLLDRAGDDSYLATVTSQGVGIPGWGFLVDCGGDDFYGTGHADGDRWADATGAGADEQCP